MSHMTWKKRAFIGFASAFEYYDIAVYVALQFYINHHFFPESNFGIYALLFTWLPFMVRYLASPFGGLFIGYYAEKHGRRAALILSSWITGVATLIMACLPTYAQIGYWAPILLFVMQLLQSFSYGGELPTTCVYLFETAAPNQRARASSILTAFNFFVVSLTLMVTGLCTMVLTEEQMLEFGWRLPLLFGALNIFIGYIIRKKMLETPTFKASTEKKIDPLLSLQLIFLFAPNTILFYTNAMATTTLVRQITPDPVLQESLPIVFTVLSALACVILGYWIDKKWDCAAILKKTYGWMILLAVPVYWLQTLNTWPAWVLSECLILFVLGISMAATVPEMYRQAGDKNKIIHIGIGFNIGGILFGATAPFFASILASYGQAYVGLLMSFGGLLYFVSVGIQKLRGASAQPSMTPQSAPSTIIKG